RAGAAHVKRVEAPWWAWRPDAEAASAAEEGRGPGRPGRRPRPGRYHVVRSRLVAESRHPRRARRGRPPRAGPPPPRRGAGGPAREDGAPPDAAVLQAYHEPPPP